MVEGYDREGLKNASPWFELPLESGVYAHNHGSHPAMGAVLTAAPAQGTVERVREMTFKPRKSGISFRRL